MKFVYRVFNTSFSIDIVESVTPVNYPDMPEKYGEYDYMKDRVFDSLPVLKRHLRAWIDDEKMSDSERYWLKDTLKATTIDSLVDGLLEETDRLFNEKEELKKQGA